MALTTAQEEILEKVIEAFENGKRLTDLPDVGDVDPITLYCEVVGDDGESKKAKLATMLPYVEEQVAYGIRRNISDSSPTCTRIGNMDMHRTCPVQNAMYGCLLDENGKEVLRLPDDSWEGATLDGSLGNVMVKIPMHYRKCQLLDDGTMEVWLSYYPLADYELIPTMYVGAYQATVQRSTNKLSSVMSSDTDYRGGNNSSANDGTYKSQLGMPASSITFINFLNYARNNGSAGKNGCGWNSYLYEVQKALTWLFVVEYATLNSQATYNAELTQDGYHQGGLGNGITNANANRWYNCMGNYFGFVPCGYTNSLGNRTGVKSFTCPFAYDAADTSGTTGVTYYVGEYDSSTAYSQGDYVSQGDDLYQCIADAPAGTSLTNTSYYSQVTRTVLSVQRYHGIEHALFGHLYMMCCDILCMVHPTAEEGGDDLSPLYVCKDPASFYLNSLTDAYGFIGNHVRVSSATYINKIIFGAKGETMGSEATGGSSSTYYCDTNSSSISVTENTLRGVMFGGNANIGAPAGAFYAYTSSAPSYSYARCGSRLCFLPE